MTEFRGQAHAARVAPTGRLGRLDIAGNVLVLLTLGGFLVLPHGQANSFSTYLIALLVYLQPRNFVQDLRAQPVLCLVAAIGSYASCSVWWSTGGDATVFFHQLVEALLVLAFVVATVRLAGSRIWLDRVLMGTVLVGTSVTALMLFDYLVSWDLAEPFVRLDGTGGAYGRLRNAVVLAMVLGFIAFVAGTFAINAGGLTRVAWTFCCLLLTVAVVLSQTRAVWLALPLSLGYYFLRRSGFQRSGFVVIAIWSLATAAAAILFALMVNQHFPSAWEQLIERGLGHRPEIWQMAITEVGGNILLGLGALATPAFPLVTWDGIPFNAHHPHSVFVSDYYFGGITGLALLVVTTVLAVRRAGTRASAMLLFGVFILILDGGQVVDKVNAIWLLLWLPVGLALGNQSDARPSRDVCLTEDLQ
jgi:hypothetical protein